MIPVGLQAAFEGGKGVPDQFLRAALLLWWLRTLGTEGGTVSAAGGDLARRLPG